jgi:hypothetical protein
MHEKNLTTRGDTGLGFARLQLLPLLCCVLLLSSAGSVHAAAKSADKSTGWSPVDCNRQCLYGVLDQYLDALVHKDPARISWAADARFTENNVELQIGDGLWGTITGLGDYKLKFADTTNGQVGFFGVVQETRDSSAFALRIKVKDHKVAAVESVVFRIADAAGIGGGESPFIHGKFVDKPILLENLAPQERRPRERMISVADGYFDTLQLNDGTLFTQFDDECNRVENGLQSTNNPELKLTRVAQLGCADQFKAGYYRFDTRLRARRYELVDEERGLVFASAFIDHAGTLDTYKLADGTVIDSNIRRPHSFYLMELFKIKNGKIRQVEAVFITVPYHMPSPWNDE